ncbi:MAG: hydroxymethylglutaryl-CoA lyase [Cocleimonas sp.]|jgi:hydroxymethylglutaryl-CoA lyase
MKEVILPTSVKIVEVGARDGLQNESTPVSVEVKIELIEQLAEAGIPVVEAGSFVSPKWVPQMAGSAEVFEGIKQKENTNYPALVPNLKGLESALESGVEEIAVFAAASESFSQKNINCSIEESISRFTEVIEKALDHKLKVRGYVSCVLGCPYEGEISPDIVADVSKRLSDLGCYEISLGDTIGTGTPVKAQTMIKVVSNQVPVQQLAAHFHNTYGQALANLFAVMEMGVSTIDSSVSGLGGCPYAKGTTGNVATEDVVYMLNGMGIESGVDLDKLLEAGRYISDHLGRKPNSNVGLAWYSN